MSLAIDTDTRTIEQVSPSVFEAGTPGLCYDDAPTPPKPIAASVRPWRRAALP